MYKKKKIYMIETNILQIKESKTEKNTGTEQGWFLRKSGFRLKNYFLCRGQKQRLVYIGKPIK